MIKSTQGAELCATHDNSRPRPGNCVNAYDETYKGKVDLSSRVQIGDPVKRSDLHWSIPYYVKDEAGNEAKPVWRDVVVEEVDFEAMESKIRQEIAGSKDAEIKKAVAKAVQEERKKFESSNKSQQRRSTTAQDCPACPVCSESKFGRAVDGGSNNNNIDLSMCDKICEERAQQCSWDEQTFVIRALLMLEKHLPAEIVPILLLILFVSGAIFVVRLIILLVFYPGSFSTSYDYASDQERERSLQNSVTYYQGGTPQASQQNRQQPPIGAPETPGGLMGVSGPPRSSMTMNQGSDFFLSPPGNSGNGLLSSPPGTNSTQQHTINDDPNGIYMSPPIIRPSPKNKGSELRRRSPGGF